MFDSLSSLVKQFESGGNYQAVNPHPAPGSSPASGAYGFVDSTWSQYASQIGISTNQYPTAASAPPAVQDQVFRQAVSQRGLADWTCPGCDPALSSYLASNPTAVNLPVSAGGASNTPTGGGLDDPAVTGNTYGPDASNAMGTGPTVGSSLLNGTKLLTPLWEILTRGAIFTLGMALLLIALIAMLWQSKTVQVNVRTLGATRAAA